MRQDAADRQRAQVAAVEGLKGFQATHLVKPGTIINVPNPIGISSLKAKGYEFPPHMEAPLPTGLKLLPPVEEEDYETSWTAAETTDPITVRLTEPSEFHADGPNVALRTGAKGYVMWEHLVPLQPPAYVAGGNFGKNGRMALGRIDGSAGQRTVDVGTYDRILERRADEVLFQHGSAKTWLEARLVEEAPEVHASAQFTAPPEPHPGPGASPTPPPPPRGPDLRHHHRRPRGARRSSVRTGSMADG